MSTKPTVLTCINNKLCLFRSEYDINTNDERTLVTMTFVDESADNEVQIVFDKPLCDEIVKRLQTISNVIEGCDGERNM